MNTQYTIRQTRTADLDPLLELMSLLQDHLEASNPDLWRMKAQARNDLKGQIAARLAAANVCALVAEHDRDGIVGMVFGRIVTNNRYTPARAGLVDQAFVLPGHRRQGVATRLVAELCHFFANEGVEDVSLRYIVGNEEAAKFWSALGFAPRIVTAGAGRRAVEERIGPA